MKDKTCPPHDLTRIVNILAFTLVAAYLLSLGASASWIADLFQHFMHQYFIGSVILAPIMLYLKRPRTSIILFITLCLSFYEIYSSSEHIQPANKTYSNTLKIVHYNRHYNLNDHRIMTEWLIKENPDIFVIQETGETHSKAIESLRGLYPYQIHEPSKGAFGFVLASKYEILSSETHQNKQYAINNISVHAQIKLSDNNIISIYASHPPPPVSALLQEQRNETLKTIAKEIQQNQTRNIIFIGDWNITPYSPYFKAFLKETGLKNQQHSFYTPPTWPSTFPLPIFQIPIDHILHKGDLHLINKRNGPHMGSDHFPIIAEFILPEQTPHKEKQWTHLQYDLETSKPSL
ncbi:MAG: hypothetical protein COA45_07960 [Zetaproteobacteria bacterium]|nr:MAG: hypothetical protein COA45_07960 [Zetaproteobacteria bacterium]